MIVTAATTNAGKLRELSRLLGPALEIRPAPPDFEPAEETADSYVENARLKARALAALVGGPALADDSGLEVDALGGGPGVHSARYGATAAERNRRLLEELSAFSGPERRARFRTALALAFADGREVVGQGACEGEIAQSPRGAGGFGYDPLFLVADLGRTFAELSANEKNRLSARSVAARALLVELERTGR